MSRLLWILGASACLLLSLGALTDIDLRLARSAFDPLNHAFPWRHTWFAETLCHVYLKRAVLLVAGAVWLLALLDTVRPQSWLARRPLRLVAMSAIVVPGAISVLKYFSYSHCPWDVMEFGGDQPYVRLLESMLPGMPAGHCFPAGHASSVLWMMAFGAFWLPRQQQCAAAVSGALLLGGVAVGWVQQLRGAHFVTHTLWSVWLACAIVAALHYLQTAAWFKPGALPLDEPAMGAP